MSLAGKVSVAVQMIHPQTTDAVPSFGGGTSNTQNFRQFGSDLVLTPAQLVEGLDNYIVGQAEGKRVSLKPHHRILIQWLLPVISRTGSCYSDACCGLVITPEARTCDPLLLVQ